MIKKLAVCVMILAMVGAMASCCTRVDPTTQVSSKSFSNCLAAAQQLMCNPTAAQQAEATAVVNFLASGISIGNLVISIPITAAEVQTVFTAVQNGGCVLTTELVQAVDWYNALVGALKTPATAAKAGLKAGVAPPPIPNINNWIKASK